MRAQKCDSIKRLDERLINILEEKIIRLALLEDSEDITTEYLIEKSSAGKGSLIAKENFVLAGCETFCNTFELLDKSGAEIAFFKKDGDSVKDGEIFAKIEGNAHVLLKGERIALNFLQHLSGIATHAARFVEIASKYGVKVLGTRKTIPGLRYLEKKAVLAGGAKNHRFSLSHGVLIKDNHIAVCGGIEKALELMRGNAPYMGKVEVEVKNIDELRTALELEVDIIMLDNMSNYDMREAVKLVNKKIPLEASGGVTLENIEEKAATGVDAISVGSLTHSAPAVDISLMLDI